jgi:hypothetical protein
LSPLLLVKERSLRVVVEKGSRNMPASEVRSKGRRRHRVALHDKDDNSSSVSPRDEATQSNVKELLSSFLSAAKVTSEADFWRNHIKLAKCVVEASLAMPRLPCGSLLLEENSAELLNVCRKLVKQATASSAEPSLVIDCLCVSVHGVRALSALLADGPKKDAAIKLLYHAIVTAEAISSSSPRAACYCLAACQVLGVLLNKYEVGDLSLKIQSTSFFPIPRQSQGKSSGDLPLDQLLTIGIQSVLAIAKLLCLPTWDENVTWDQTELRVWRETLQHSLHWPNEQPSVLFASSLIRNVAMAWISFLATSSKSAKEVVSHCKRAHRLLWKSSGELTSAKKCLSLRQDAVQALLLSGSPQCDNDCRIRNSLRADHFEQACTFTWTAAVAYAQQVGETDEHLSQFHKTVGATLDSIARNGSSTASYMEYCAYRALHGISSSSVSSSSTTECDSDACSFHGRPYSFAHANCEESFDRAGLALFFVMLEVRERLQGSPVDRSDFGSWKSALERFAAILERGQLSKTSLLRWFKLFSKLSLHHIVFQAVANSEQNETLWIAARILSECVGPLTLYIIKGRVMDDTKITNAWDIVTECYVRALMAFERLFETSPEFNRDPGDSTLAKMATILCAKGSDPPTSCIEKAAKVRSCKKFLLYLFCCLGVLTLRNVLVCSKLG